MSHDRGNGRTKALGAVAALAAAFATRKVLTFAWKQITGKEPPSDPHDPQIGIGEAISWAVLLGVGIETARLLAIRAATRKMRQVEGTNSE